MEQKNLFWIKISNGEVTSSISNFLNEEIIKSIKEKMNAEDDDLILILADKNNIVLNSLGVLRGVIARNEFIKSNEYNLCWIVDFPLFEYDDEAQRYVQNIIRLLTLKMKTFNTWKVIPKKFVKSIRHCNKR